MTALDLRLGPKVFDLINERGLKGSFLEPVAPTYDASTGIGTRGTPIFHVKSVSPPSAFNDQFIDGDIIKRGDVQIILPRKELLLGAKSYTNITFEPIPGMQVTFTVPGPLGGTQAWRIVRVTPIFTGTDIAAYKCHMRQ